MWNKLLRPHWVIVLLLTAISGGGLVFIFSGGWEASLPACCFYPLCAYSLAALCIRLVPQLPGLLARAKTLTQWKENDLSFRRSLISGAVINLIYALFQMLLGHLTVSSWTGNQGAYQLVMGLIHVVMLWYEEKYRKAGSDASIGWKGFRSCGICLLALHLVMTGLTFQMIWQGETEEYPSVLIFAVATYTFYKLTLALVRVLRYKKNTNPLWGAAKNIDLSEAIMNLYILQTALLLAFSQPEQESFRFLMNSLTGGVVCLMTIGGAWGMIHHANKKLQGGSSHG